MTLTADLRALEFSQSINVFPISLLHANFVVSSTLVPKLCLQATWDPCPQLPFSGSVLQVAKSLLEMDLISYNLSHQSSCVCPLTSSFLDAAQLSVFFAAICLGSVASQSKNLE